MKKLDKINVASDKNSANLTTARVDQVNKVGENIKFKFLEF